MLAWHINDIFVLRLDADWSWIGLSKESDNCTSDDLNCLRQGWKWEDGSQTDLTALKLFHNEPNVDDNCAILFSNHWWGRACTTHADACICEKGKSWCLWNSVILATLWIWLISFLWLWSNFCFSQIWFSSAFQIKDGRIWLHLKWKRLQPLHQQPKPKDVQQHPLEAMLALLLWWQKKRSR